MVAVLSILGGAALGTRYKVFCLIPIIAIGIALITFLDRVNAVPLSSTVLSSVALAIGLQVGYFGGVAARLACVSKPRANIIEPTPFGDQPAGTF